MELSFHGILLGGLGKNNQPTHYGCLWTDSQYTQDLVLRRLRLVDVQLKIMTSYSLQT